MALVLDCTFRDGGYYTNWDFEESLVTQYFQAISRAAVDTLEIGYVGNATGEYLGKFYYLTPEDCTFYKSQVRADQKICVMINLKEFKPSEIAERFTPYVGKVDIVRMAVPPSQVKEANEIATELRKFGFLVGLNLMYLSTYFDKAASVLGDVDQSLYYCVSLVDSYGGCFPNQVKTAVAQAKSLLSIPVGFHGHNNVELAFANALASIEAGVDYLDSTITGMGRGAGNLKTEMIVSYLEAAGKGQSSDLSSLGALVERFEAMQKVFGWGSNLPYIISGLNSLPQKDVMDWLGKARYSTSAIVAALRSASSEQFIDQTEYPSLPSDRADKPVLIVGGGQSVQAHAQAIQRMAAKTGATVVHSSLKNLAALGQVQGMCLACLPGHEVEKAPDVVGDNTAFIVQAAPRFKGTLPSELSGRVYQTTLFNQGQDKKLGPVSDAGPLALALSAARDLGSKSIYLVGFDGYANATRSQQELANETQRLLDEYVGKLGTTKLVSLTPTAYNLPTDSVYRYI